MLNKFMYFVPYATYILKKMRRVEGYVMLMSMLDW